MCLMPMGLWRLEVMAHFVELGFSKAAVEAAMLKWPEKWTKKELDKWAKGAQNINKNASEEGD